MKKHFVRRKGFISVYFLSILLAVSVCCTLCALNDQRKMEAALYLEMNNRYFLQEQAVVNDLRCRLMNREAEDGWYQTLPTEYLCIREGNTISAEIGGELAEKIIIDIDENTGMITEVKTERMSAVITSYLR